MSESSIISAGAKQRTRTSTPLRGPEPESNAGILSIPEEPVSPANSQDLASQRLTPNVRSWSRSKDTSKGTGIWLAGYEFTEHTVARFWEKYRRNESNGCLEWTGALFDGYGRFFTRRASDRRGYSFQAHKVAYVLATGSDPSPLCVLHKCDNRLCGDPGHLFIGTRKDNAEDAKSKGRTKRDRLTPDRVRLVVELTKTLPLAVVARSTGVREGSIRKILTGKSYSRFLRSEAAE